MDNRISEQNTNEHLECDPLLNWLMMYTLSRQVTLKNSYENYIIIIYGQNNTRNESVKRN